MIFLPLLILALMFGIGIELINPNADTYLNMFEFIIGFLIRLLDILLAPINFLIVTYIPSLDNALSYIAQYFNYADTYIGWILSATGFPTLSITLLASYFFFKFSISLGVYSFKTLLKWKEALL